jgi:hypothetical protein
MNKQKSKFDRFVDQLTVPKWKKKKPNPSSPKGYPGAAFSYAGHSAGQGKEQQEITTFSKDKHHGKQLSIGTMATES